MTITVSIDKAAPSIHIDPKPAMQPTTIDQLETMLQSSECAALVTAYANVVRGMAGIRPK